MKTMLVKLVKFTKDIFVHLNYVSSLSAVFPRVHNKEKLRRRLI